MKKENVIEFIRQKDYKFIRDIGRGGLGETKLLLDETIGEQFVCKKYSPIEEEMKPTYYNNFVQEIKLLHLIHHRNIVRVFNYYLYPDQLTGYILMEFINGTDINTYLKDNPDKLNEVFSQTIEGFKYLEHLGILHRDIRPFNILVSNDGVVKIIDFGFGKKIDFGRKEGKSITLNWAFTQPDEFKNKIYDAKTEIYFVAKLFEFIITENGISGFAHNGILKDMVTVYNSRVDSFFDISRRITEGSSAYHEFDEYEKAVYQRFAGQLQALFVNIQAGSSYNGDINKIIQSLNEICQSSILEEDIQNVVEIARVFVNGQYTYYKKIEFPVQIVRDFLSLLKGLSGVKQRIVITHLWNRLDKVARLQPKDDDDLPF
jgi:serine/threonine-protein kinase